MTVLKPLCDRNPYIDKYRYELLYFAEYYLGLFCLLEQKCSSEKKKQYYLEIITCDPRIYTIDLHKFIAMNQKVESISTQKLSGGSIIEL